MTPPIGPAPVKTAPSPAPAPAPAAVAKKDDGFSKEVSPPATRGFPTTDVFTREEKDALRSTVDRPGPLATKPQYDPMSLPNADKSAPPKEWWKAPIAKVAKQANKDIPTAAIEGTPAGKVLDATGGKDKATKALKDAKLGEKVVEAVVKKTIEETVVKAAQGASSQGSGNAIDPKEIKGKIDIPVVPTITIPW